MPVYFARHVSFIVYCGILVLFVFVYTKDVNSLQVDFHKLKIKILGSSAKAIDHAWDALRIAQECQFTKEVLWLKEHIRKQQIFPEDPANDTAGLLKMVFEIVTATDGNLESNAAEFTDTGLFSSDDSEWDILTVDSFR